LVDPGSDVPLSVVPPVVFGEGGGVVASVGDWPPSEDGSSARAVGAHEASSARTSHAAVRATAGASLLLDAGVNRTAVVLGIADPWQERDADTY
jgi:hypothetical protein